MSGWEAMYSSSRRKNECLDTECSIQTSDVEESSSGSQMNTKLWHHRDLGRKACGLDKQCQREQISFSPAHVESRFCISGIPNRGGGCAYAARMLFM